MSFSLASFEARFLGAALGAAAAGGRRFGGYYLASVFRCTISMNNTHHCCFYAQAIKLQMLV